MNFSDDFIQELKYRNNILDVVSSYVSLKRKGSNMAGLCPFHSERTASFFVYPSSDSFYCFGCGAGGDVITFIRLIERFDYIESIKYLAQRAGMQMPNLEKDDASYKKKMMIYEINREIAKFYYSCLKEPGGKKALDYLIKRGLKTNTIRRFGLGYSPEGGFSACNHLKKIGYNEKDIILANIAAVSRSGKIYDRFRGRIMFPIIDLRGNVIAFGGRTLTDANPKYLNTADTLVFKKSENVFALNFAKNKIKENLILAEGYMDVISLHQAGFENAVATLGTSLTEGQVKLMARFTKEIVISYDSDEAGRKAADRAIKLCRMGALSVKVLNVPKGKDPDEFIKNYGKEGKIRFKNLIENSKNDVEYRIGRVKSGYDLEKTEDRIKYLNECIKILCEIESPIECEIYASKLSEETGIEKKSILLQVERNKKNRRKKSENEKFKQIQNNIFKKLDKLSKENGVSLRSISAEEALLSTIINNLDMVNNISSKINPSLFMNSLNKKIYEAVCKLNAEGRNIDVTTLCAQGFGIEDSGYIAKLFCSYIPSKDVKKDLMKYISILKNEKEMNDLTNTESIDKYKAKKYIENLREKR